MSRTTINVDKETHSEAKAVKDEFDETWPEVLEWYADHRGESDGNQEVDPEAIAESVADHLNDYEWHVDTEQVSEEVVKKFDIEDLAEDISKTLGSDLEMSAYRGTKDALESVKR